MSSYSGSFGLGPSPRGRSASRPADGGFSSPGPLSSRSRSRVRLTDNPFDPISNTGHTSRPLSRSRRPSISLAHTGASFLSFGPHEVDHLAFAPPSPAPRSPRSPSYYPPSSSKSGPLSYAPSELPIENRIRSRSRSRSRSTRRSSIDLDDASPDGFSAPSERPFKSKFFGSATSSSESDPSDPRSSAEDHMVPGRRPSRSSGRSKGSDPFESVGSGRDLPDVPAAPVLPRPPRELQPHRRTSFQSGLSGQMEYDSNGIEHFKPGSEIHLRHTEYHRHQALAEQAEEAYESRKEEFPRHPRRDRVAIGDANRFGLGANYTAPEHRELRRLAHQGFRHKRDETFGRESFNETYGTVWEKRTRQTGRDSVKNHQEAADGARSNGDEMLRKAEAHRRAMIELGVRDDDLTSYSSWGSRDGGHI
ncbi:hypothetical protein F5144DRAFT_544263 [Chaetomium tenue]|uniref:Uncharacterized protein n=1 Tax=Chaetomium tenue TaxID=1854479 RepID=A0ACB7PQC9_9PEZI|nr:hypothetical protein F5144DRAFT_544263 [Chaetomium globosum]